MSKTPEQIVALVKEAGVVGAGGQGIPTYLKLQSRADLVIINGCECEPLVHTDKYLLKNFAGDIIQGLKIAMIASGAKQGVLALNCEDPAGIKAVQKFLTPDLRIHLMGNYYPSGDELLMVYDVTGRVVPEGASPLSAGVLVLNVMTARQVYQAVNGMVAIERTLTVGGAVNEPAVLSVPVGTRYSELIALAGGPVKDRDGKKYCAVEGGLMRGVLVADLEQGISKTTSSLILLPHQHYVIQMKSKTLDEVVKQSKAVSGQGTQNTDLCPRHLLGHAIDPDQTMRTLDYSQLDSLSPITSSYLCSGCGICELVGDEASFTSPKRVFAEFKKRLVHANVPNPHHRQGFPVHSQFENRKLSLPTLIKKLGIAQYGRPPKFVGKKDSALVRIPLNQEGPAKVQHTVALGAKVRRGDLIAESKSLELETRSHASIHGTVSNLQNGFIEITGEAS